MANSSTNNSSWASGSNWAFRPIQPLFGPTSTTAQPQPLFGPTSTTAQPQPLFGPTSTTAQHQPLFGSTSTTAQHQPFFGSTSTTAQHQPLFGSTSTTAQHQPLFGSTPTTAQHQPLFGSTPTTAQHQPLFGSTSTTAQHQPLFGSTSTTAQHQPLFGSTSTTAQHQPLFGSTPTTAQPQPLFGSTSTTAQPQPLFGSTPTTAQLFGASNINLEPLKLPKNKVKGLLFMVSLNQQNTLDNSKLLISNVFNPTLKFDLNSLWFTSLIKFSDPNFLEKKVDQDLLLFSKLFSCLLKNLMVESIQTPEQLYEWLVEKATKLKSKRMLLLFTLLERSRSKSFDDILNLTNPLDALVSALHLFIQFDNNPTKVVKHALECVHLTRKTFLLAMVGSSYGKDFLSKDDPPLLDEIVSKLSLD
jgi:hypothetical protein